ncbi:transglutaminase domain-containing protein [Chitinophaga sp. CF418]|uniref:transglutaminase domain-containing protein n=1 Tax=Chitinophaga sp. CF418 TaxID=1855287 RepID=UPI0009185753|nr:transglutaminase domain-containing protein [Chitinophaga sp. CF418]SHM96033.1 Transglutaminase-like superfamily protein [Chitinophaga sp. CF418]
MRVVFILLTVITLFSVSSLCAQPKERVSTERPVPAALVIPEADLATPVTFSHYLSAHTTSRKEFVRQLYSWLVWNVGYDVPNMYSPDYYKDTLDAAQKTLKTRIGVCQGYANLYYLVCKEAGIPVHLVGGYTKTYGKISNASHAWIAVQLDNTWYMTDPTWGAGVVNNNKFIRKPVDSYFLVAPSAFVETYMPFDPLWQLLEHPYRHDEFRDNNLKAAAGRAVFNYKDSLAAYETMKDDLLKYQLVINRIEGYGVTNQLISHELAYYKNLVKYIAENRQIAAANKAIDDFNRSSNQYNRAVNLFNEYVQFKNKQFRPSKPDSEIREMVAAVGRKLAESRKGLAGLNRNEGTIRANISELEESLSAMEKRLNEEQAFVDKYIRTGKMFRKTLF